MIALLATLALAGAGTTDPALDGVPIPAGVDVRLERVGATWTIDIDGRRTVVDAPEGEAGLEAFRALVASLAADVPLVPTGSAATLALAMVGPPPAPAPSARAPAPAPSARAPGRAAPSAPAPAHAPAPGPVVAVDLVPAADPGPAADPVPTADPLPTPDPDETLPDDAFADLDLPTAPPPLALVPTASSRWSVWVGPELVLRPAVRPGVGLAVGLDRGTDPLGASTLLAVRAPRELVRARGSRVDEVALGAGAWLRPVPHLRVAGGLGAVARRWWSGGEFAAVHLVPLASAGLAVPFALGGREVSVGSSAELDLGRTTVRTDRGPFTLSPIAVRAEVRIAGRAGAPPMPDSIEPGSTSRTSVR